MRPSQKTGIEIVEIVFPIFRKKEKKHKIQSDGVDSHQVISCHLNVVKRGMRCRYESFRADVV